MPAHAKRRTREEQLEHDIRAIQITVPGCLKLLEAEQDPYFRDLVRRFQPRFRECELVPLSLNQNNPFWGRYSLADITHFWVGAVFRGTDKRLGESLDERNEVYFSFDLAEAETPISFSYDPSGKAGVVLQLEDHIRHILLEKMFKDRRVLVSLSDDQPTISSTEEIFYQWHPSPFVCTFHLLGEAIPGFDLPQTKRIAWEGLLPPGPERAAVEKAIAIQRLKEEFLMKVRSLERHTRIRKAKEDLCRNWNLPHFPVRLQELRVELGRSLKEAGE